MTFPEKLQQLRKKAGLTQATLAEAAGLGTSTVRDYEQGLREPTIRSAFRLAAALGVSLDAFSRCAEFVSEKPKKTG